MDAHASAKDDVNMKTLLKLDYDTHDIEGVFAEGAYTLAHVYLSDRGRKPNMRVQTCMRTKKGFHVVVEFADVENWDTKHECALALLLLQTCMRSDSARSVHDMLRVSRNERVFNLLFEYKNGFRCKDDLQMLNKLNMALDKLGVLSAER